MSDASAPHQHHSDDAEPAEGLPTDAVTDEVKADSAPTDEEPDADAADQAS